jgi:hypothetical protein
MRHSTLAAAAIAAGLTVAAAPANAMLVATPGQFGLTVGTSMGAGAVKKTVLICDPWTCYWRPDYWGYDRQNPYRGWRRHYWWGWHRPWWGWRS